MGKSMHTYVAREQLELREASWLHPLAQRGDSESIQRQEPAEPCPLRTEFMRDRDRILHSKAFRRLKHKTQVFIAPEGDHFRTRLTHSLEVMQIARTMSRALRLNEDVTEAIALGHDLGHPPFGHAGEEALGEASPIGFKHTRHSIRIATVLEPLNLTSAVLRGLGDQERDPAHSELSVLLQDQPALSLEAQVVALADRIAYLHHDVEDAVRAELLRESDLPADLRQCLGQTQKERLDRMVLDAVSTSATLLESSNPRIGMSPEVWEAMMALRHWMFQSIYLSPRQQSKDAKVKHLIHNLIAYYREHPEALPSNRLAGLRSAEPEAPDSREQTIIDYIAGMTDRFALKTYQQLLLPESLSV